MTEQVKNLRRKRKIPKEELRHCKDCRNYGTIKCPPSPNCFSEGTKPFFKMTYRKKHSFADYIVYGSILAVVLFTIAAFVLQFSGMMEISATLTTAWFAFWTVEIVSLAAIKNSKTKHNKGDTEE